MVQEMVEIDLGNEDLGLLARVASRIAALLDLEKVRRNQAAVACLDDFLGAIYALMFARLNGFTDRVGVPIEPDKVLVRAEQIAMGKARTDGKWMAGFHFNSALFRIAATYHRALKVVLEEPTAKAYAPALQPRASKRYHSWRSMDWQSACNKAVYKEVNLLKHTPKGVYPGRQVQFKKALCATEELLELVEAWASQS